MHFQIRETVETEALEQVLQSLEGRLRPMAREVVRKGERLTAFGIGPSPRAMNANDRTEVQATVEGGATLLVIDVDYQASALLAGTPQDEIVRTKILGAIGQTRDELGIVRIAAPTTDAQSFEPVGEDAGRGEEQLPTEQRPAKTVVFVQGRREVFARAEGRGAAEAEVGSAPDATPAAGEHRVSVPDSSQEPGTDDVRAAIQMKETTTPPAPTAPYSPTPATPATRTVVYVQARPVAPPAPVGLAPALESKASAPEVAAPVPEEAKVAGPAKTVIFVQAKPKTEAEPGSTYPRAPDRTTQEQKPEPPVRRDDAAGPGAGSPEARIPMTRETAAPPVPPVVPQKLETVARVAEEIERERRTRVPDPGRLEAEAARVEAAGLEAVRLDAAGVNPKPQVAAGSDSGVREKTAGESRRALFRTREAELAAAKLEAAKLEAARRQGVEGADLDPGKEPVSRPGARVSRPFLSQSLLELEVLDGEAPVREPEVLPEAGERHWRKGAVAALAVVAALIALGAYALTHRDWAQAQYDSLMSMVYGNEPAATTTGAPVSSGAKPQGQTAHEANVRTWVDDWAEAMRSNDAAGQAFFYADPVDQYFLRSHVNKDYVLRDKRSGIQARKPGFTFAVENVVVETQTDTEAMVRLVKRYSIGSRSGAPSIRLVRSILKLRKVNGAWKIAEERDFR
ncbi:MAG: hypothetical protein NVSMB3_02910 [Acidobacteriaceae bacterium]